MSDSKCCGECDGHGAKCGEHCGHGFACHKSFFFVRWIIGFIILAIVFCVGVSVGRFIGEVDSYYDGYGLERGGYSRMMRLDDYGYGPSMMRGWYFQTPDISVTPAPTTKTK